jgi:uncharacterized protein (TIGR03546 family)
MIKLIAKFIVTLSSNAAAAQVAAGLASGLALALIPPGNLLWPLLFLALFFTKSHYAVMLASAALLKPAAVAAAPLIDGLGWEVLTHPALEPTLTAFYNAPVAPLTRFNDTLVAGGILAAVALWLPAFAIGLVGVRAYRKRLAPALAKSPLVVALKKLPLVKALSGAIGAARRVGEAL